MDGQLVELEQANLGFMAVEISAGSHDVELRYETPNMKIGAVLSLAGIIAAVTIAIGRRAMKRRFANCL